MRSQYSRGGWDGVANDDTRAILKSAGADDTVREPREDKEGASKAMLMQEKVQGLEHTAGGVGRSTKSVLALLLVLAIGSLFVDQKALSTVGTASFTSHYQASETAHGPQTQSQTQGKTAGIGVDTSTSATTSMPISTSTVATEPATMIPASSTASSTASSIATTNTATENGININADGGSTSSSNAPHTSTNAIAAAIQEPAKKAAPKRGPGLECYKAEFDAPKVVTYDANFTFETKVPFYVYDNELSMLDMTTCGVPLNITEYTYFKHSDDYWLLQSALGHPMRTKDPEEAKLFFVPFLMNAIADGYEWRNRQLCIQNDTVCFDPSSDADATVNWTDIQLSKSEYFQRSNGSDHVLVMSHYMMQRKFHQYHVYPNLLRCNRVVYQNFPQRHKHDKTTPDRIEIQNLYVANLNGCQPTTPGNKTTDFAMIASMKRTRPNFRDRFNICTWMKSGNFSYDVCGKGKMCPALADARFGFHARGDDLGSNRPFDIVASGTVPLFTRMGQYDIMPDFAPFRNMSYFVDVSSPSAFRETMRAVANVTKEEYDAKLTIVKKYANRVDVKSGEPFDAYMAMFARKLGLQD